MACRGFVDESAAPLLLLLHGQALRLLSVACNQHVMGIAQGARKCRSQLSAKTTRRLFQLDTVAAWLRHATPMGCDDFIAALR
eukprot:748895-Prorocentrum_lima.AAC.1